MKTYGRFQLGGRVVRSVLLLGPFDDRQDIAGADAIALDLRTDRWSEMENAGAAVAAFARRLGAADEPPALLALVPQASDTEALASALSLVVPHAPQAVVLSGATCGADIQKADVMMSVEEAKAGLAVGHTAILALAGDNPKGPLAAASFAGKSKRLVGLGWHPEALAASLATPRSFGTRPLPCGLATARGLTLLGAAAAGVAAIDWLDRGADGNEMTEMCQSSLTDGFSAMICERQEQVAVINRLFA